MLLRRLAAARWLARSKSLKKSASADFPDICCTCLSSSHPFSYYPFSTSTTKQWRSREERRLALHRKDDDPKRLAKAANNHAKAVAAASTGQTDRHNLIRKQRTGRRRDRLSLGVCESPDQNGSVEQEAETSYRTSSSSRSRKLSAERAEDPQKAELKAKVKQQLVSPACSQMFLPANNQPIRRQSKISLH